MYLPSDVDECEQIQCIEGECENLIGSYQCVCDEYHMIHPSNPHFCIMGVSSIAEENHTEEKDLFRGLTWSYNDPVCGDQVRYPTLLQNLKYKVRLISN